MVEIIRNRNDMDVKQERDYIRQMKTSGYRSYHRAVNTFVLVFFYQMVKLCCHFLDGKLIRIQNLSP